MLVFAKPSAQTFWMGLPLVVLGELIRIWSAGYLYKMEKLTTAGPFALCRNPLYVGSFFISAGYFIMTGQPVVLIVGVILFWVFHGGAVAYEEGMLREKFGDEFVVYCKIVPRFVPRLRSLAGYGTFSLMQIRQNHELRSLTATLIASGAFALISYLPNLAPFRLLSNLGF